MALTITNARVFEPEAGALTEPRDVTIEGNTISEITASAPGGDSPGSQSESDADTVIDAAGRSLIPGLIDAHWHASMVATTQQAAVMADPGFAHVAASVAARGTLLRGFTTVRDMGGPVFGLKLAIDTGLVPGPRIYPSGAFISQSGGHGDFRFPFELPRGKFSRLSNHELLGVTAIADGTTEVLRAAREQLQLGASQLKVMAGGGVSSHYDPLDATQYTEPEIRAAVDAAENWGTYVTVHAYTPRAIQQAVRAGVRCIEHGQLADEASVELMAEHDVWLSVQPFLMDEDANPKQGESLVKQQQVSTGTDTAIELARKHQVRIGWGTDMLFNPTRLHRQGAQLAKMQRWFTPAEVLTMATRDNAAILEMSGPRSPYRGKLGVVQEGALADLILVDGDPLADIELLARPDEAFAVIVKDGKVVKNTLAA